MDSLKVIADKAYKQYDEETKEAIRNVFRIIDSNGDRRISFKELKDSGFFTEGLLLNYDQFDRDDNGFLDFKETWVLLFYTFVVPDLLGRYEHAGPRICDYCGDWQDLADCWSCFKCLSSFPDYTYHLCFDCYDEGAYSSHQHQEWCLLDQESMDLIELYRRGLSTQGKQFLRRIQSNIGSTSTVSRDRSSSTMDPSMYRHDQRQIVPASARMYHQDQRQIIPSNSRVYRQDQQQIVPYSYGVYRQDQQQIVPYSYGVYHHDQRQFIPSGSRVYHQDRRQIVPANARAYHQDQRQIVSATNTRRTTNTANVLSMAASAVTIMGAAGGCIIL